MQVDGDILSFQVLLLARERDGFVATSFGLEPPRAGEEPLALAADAFDTGVDPPFDPTCLPDIFATTGEPPRKWAASRTRCPAYSARAKQALCHPITFRAGRYRLSARSGRRSLEAGGVGSGGRVGGWRSNRGSPAARSPAALRFASALPVTKRTWDGDVTNRVDVRPRLRPAEGLSWGSGRTDSSDQPTTPITLSQSNCGRTKRRGPA
jgi:hypothetical protein